MPRPLVRYTQAPSNSIVHNMMESDILTSSNGEHIEAIIYRIFSSPTVLPSVFVVFYANNKDPLEFCSLSLFEYGETYINVQSFISCWQYGWLVIENATKQRQLWLLLLYFYHHNRYAHTHTYAQTTTKKRDCISYSYFFTNFFQEKWSFI